MCRESVRLPWSCATVWGRIEPAADVPIRRFLSRRFRREWREYDDELRASARAHFARVQMVLAGDTADDGESRPR